MRLLVAVLALVVGWSGLAWVTATPAAASPSGTGGQYVPIAQANLVDTWQNVGYSGPIPANTVVTLQINGQVGLPSTGVAAVVLSVMTINVSGTPGTIYGQANAGSTTSSQSMLVYSGTGADSNNAIVENGTNGKIDIFTSTSTQVRIDVQGYFTVGNGSPAPGGYVSGAADAGSTGTLALNQTSAGIKATGIGAVPITATAVFANLEVDATASAPGPVGKLVAFPASTSPPATMLSYELGQKTMIGTIIDLDAQGMLKIKITEGPSVSVKVNIIGYFDGQASNDGITPVHNRVYDTAAISSPIPAGQTRDVQVAGVQSVPANGCSMAAVDFHLETWGSSADGSITAWPSDESMPAAITMLHTANSAQSNAAILRVGCADGKIKVRNNSASGSIQLIVDVQNYFTNTDVVGPASGLSGWRSGSRADHQPIARTLNDRMGLEVDPAVGNLLVTQSLLNITGIGPSVGVNVRYNAQNDYRPTMNLGLFESQLYRNSNNTLTYTDAKGTTFDFSPVGNGTYVVPKNINAHLTRTVSGSPDAAISAGATYELVFHPAQIKNVYVSDGANLRLTETRDITGNNKITYTYSGGRLTSLTDTQGRVVTFGYSNSPNPTQPTTITDTSLNRSITLVYAGPKGALTKVTDATGAQTTWAYNAGNKLASVTDGAGRRTEFTYTGSENKIATIKFGAHDAAVAGTWSFAYLTGPVRAEVTDPNSRMTKYEYNDTTKVVTRVTDARGNPTSSDFNPHGDLLKTTNAATNFTTYTVESASFTYNLTKVTSPTGGTGGTGPAGRTGEAIYPSTIVGGGATVDYRPTSLKDSQGNLTNLQYNSWGQTAQEDRGWDAGTSTAVAGTWTYKYQGGSGTTAATCGGKSGQICSYTDGKGNVTSFAYNAAGNLTTMTPPAPLGASSYTYDAAGRRITVLDGNGVTTYTCYDANDRVTQVSTTSSACGTASGVRTTYDQSGNATTINNTTNSTVATVTWDAQSRPTNRTWTITGTTQPNLASAATYDRAGNVLTAVDGGTGAANTTTYTYDAANNVITLAEPGGSCPATPAWPNTTGCTGFEYDANNQRIKTKFPNGVASTVAYDTSQRISSTTLSGVTGVSPQPSWTWAYQSATATDAGLVSSLTDEAGNKFAYTYDKANRLLTAQRKNSGGTATWDGSWTLDKNGNRTQQVVNGATTNYGYNAADQLCWYGTGTSSTCTAPGGATALTYDGNGNQTSGGPTYTPFNQLATSGATTYSYSGTTQTQRLSYAGTPYTPSLISNQTTQHGTSSSPVKIIRDPSGALIGYQGGGGNYYYITDRQGSVVLITGGTGNSAAVAADYDYAPYGATISATGGQATTNKYRYIGAFIDDTSTGLYKMGARYYNQDTGRFTQPDPSAQETNRYNYTNSNPATLSDPSGLCSWDEDCGYVEEDYYTDQYNGDEFGYWDNPGCVWTLVIITWGVLAIPATAGLSEVALGVAGASTSFVYSCQNSY